MSEAKRDENRISTILGVSNVDAVTPVTVYADPITHRLLVDSTDSSSGVTVLIATGTVDDANTTFTFASEPTVVVVNGATYRTGKGCTITGTTVTIGYPVGTGGDIFGLK